MVRINPYPIHGQSRPIPCRVGRRGVGFRGIAFVRRSTDEPARGFGKKWLETQKLVCGIRQNSKMAMDHRHFTPKDD
jgi:hypothetical protein